MDEVTRRTRFEERVRVERMFLVPVNEVFGHVVPLGGMTGSAIETWQKGPWPSDLREVIDLISAVLREASLRAELLADNSKEVFERGKLIPRDGLDEVMISLKLGLAAARPQTPV